MDTSAVKCHFGILLGPSPEQQPVSTSTEIPQAKQLAKQRHSPIHQQACYLEAP